MLKRTMSALAIAAIAYAGVAQAQENATLTLRSGERISGQLMDMGGVGFTIKVNNEDRRIPTDQVAVIDFSGGNMSASDWNQVSSGQHVIWLKSGQTVTGQLYDIGGTTPLNITFKTGSGDREIPSSDIARIVLARTDAAQSASSGATTSAATGTTSGGGVVVAGSQPWTSTGIMVRRGEVLTLNPTGEVNIGNNETANPAGVQGGRTAADAPVPGAAVGALIGRIGNGAPFVIGNQTTVTVPASGMLFLGVNDNHFGDNNGEFRVEITRNARRR